MNLKWMGQTDAALAQLHSHQRYLKPLNVLLTTTEDMKFAGFGLAREYIALKQRIHSTKRSFMDDQLHMNSGVGSIHRGGMEVSENTFNKLLMCANGSNKTKIDSRDLIHFKIRQIHPCRNTHSFRCLLGNQKQHEYSDTSFLSSAPDWGRKLTGHVELRSNTR